MSTHGWTLFVAFLGLGLVLGCTGGCTSGGTIAADSFLAQEDVEGASSDGFPAPNKTRVWETAMRTVRAQGYVPDPDASSPVTGTIVTRWRISLQPFSGQGWRERVSLKVLPIASREGFYTLETNVIRQLNDNLGEPDNPLRAEWTQGARNDQRERMINQQVEIAFLPMDVSEGFRRKYGMPSVKNPRTKPVPKPKKKEGLIPGLPELPFP